MGKIIGIDLGTTNSAMAVMEGGKPEIIANAEGNRTTPSVVAINKTGERLVGQLARRQAVTNPGNTVYEMKRLIGRRWEDKEVQRDIKLMGYEMVKSGNSVKIKMGDSEYSPEELSAMVLSKLKADAEAFLGQPVTEATGNHVECGREQQPQRTERTRARQQQIDDEADDDRRQSHHRVEQDDQRIATGEAADGDRGAQRVLRSTFSADRERVLPGG